jgi:hypothetical protein
MAGLIRYEVFLTTLIYSGFEFLGEASETTIPSVSELTDSIKSLSGERNILKFLCNKLFTQNEIINCSRTGKKNPSKSGDTVRYEVFLTTLIYSGFEFLSLIAHFCWFSNFL